MNIFQKSCNMPRRWIHTKVGCLSHRCILYYSFGFCYVFIGVMWFITTLAIWLSEVYCVKSFCSLKVLYWGHWSTYIFSIRIEESFLHAIHFKNLTISMYRNVASVQCNVKEDLPSIVGQSCQDKTDKTDSTSIMQISILRKNWIPSEVKLMHFLTFQKLIHFLTFQQWEVFQQIN